MKFGVLQFFSWPKRRVPIETVYTRSLERVQIMDQSGYDAVWLAEHHFGSYSVSPSVLLMGTHIAAKTSNIRIGTAITLAAFYHPLRLAEEIALLDILSGGRVNWGAGRGFDAVEFKAFGVDRKDSYPLFHENIEIVLEAWRNERLTYHGKYYSFDDIEVLPKPLQKPHPPTWIASSSPEAIEWAAGQGHDILMDPHAPHIEIGRKRAFYKAELERHGFSDEGRDIPMARLLAVAETEDAARSVAAAGAQWMFSSYMEPGLNNVLSDLRSYEGRAEGEDTRSAERYLKDVIIYGTPDSVADQLLQLQEEINLHYLLCAPLSHDTFTLLTEKVLPKFL